MKIREINKRDIPEVSRLFNRNNPSKESGNKLLKEEILEMFNNNSSRPTFLVAEENNKIVGYIGYAPSRINYRVYQIFFLQVDVNFQNKGIGTKLLDRAIKDIKSKRRYKKDDYLILLTSVKPAYYKNKFGFKTLTKIKVNGSCLMALRV